MKSLRHFDDPAFDFRQDGSLALGRDSALGLNLDTQVLLYHLGGVDCDRRVDRFRDFCRWSQEIHRGTDRGGAHEHCKGDNCLFWFTGQCR